MAKLKTRCSTFEKENTELRRLVGGDRTPKYLPLSPTAHSPSPSSSTTPETEQSPITPYHQHDQDTSTTTRTTPKQSFKKIFGKVKRSNSGGELKENGNKGQQSNKISMVEDPAPQTFR